MINCPLCPLSLQVKDADAVAVLTEWDIFKTLDWAKVFSLMQVRNGGGNGGGNSFALSLFSRSNAGLAVPCLCATPDPNKRDFPAPSI